MARLPRILVAGGGDLYIQLLDPFPPSVCNVVSADTSAEALDLAGNCNLVVVDSELDGGVELCRRLRSDPVTSSLPLILRVATRDAHVQAIGGVRVVAGDTNGLHEAMRQMCPALTTPPQMSILAPAEEDADDGYFDEGPTTVLFRRPEAAPGDAGGWPSAPPIRAPKQDMLDFAQVYCGYMNSLLEAMDAPSKLSADELGRLRSMSNLTVDSTELHLTALQTAITEALVGKDLDRMKVLSSAKNSMYAKLQQMRLMVVEMPAPAAAAVGETPRPVPPAVPGKPAAAPGGLKKSELTIAAEAQEAKAKEGGGKPPKPPEKARGLFRRGRVPTAGYRSQRSALRDQVDAESSSRRLRLVAGVALLLVGVLVFYLLWLRGGPDRQKDPRGNQPPRMKWVQIEQTSVAVVARAEAEDHENDAVVFTFRWLVNGQPISGESTARLLAHFYKENDTVAVEITAADSYANGPSLLSRAIVIKPMARPVPAADSGTP